MTNLQYSESWAVACLLSRRFFRFRGLTTCLDPFPSASENKILLAQQENLCVPGYRTALFLSPELTFPFKHFSPFKHFRWSFLNFPHRTTRLVSDICRLQTVDGRRKVYIALSLPLLSANYKQASRSVILGNWSGQKSACKSAFCICQTA